MAVTAHPDALLPLGAQQRVEQTTGLYFAAKLRPFDISAGFRKVMITSTFATPGPAQFLEVSELAPVEAVHSPQETAAFLASPDVKRLPASSIGKSETSNGVTARPPSHELGASPSARTSSLRRSTRGVHRVSSRRSSDAIEPLRDSLEDSELLQPPRLACRLSSLPSGIDDGAPAAFERLGSPCLEYPAVVSPSSIHTTTPLVVPLNDVVEDTTFDLSDHAPATPPADRCHDWSFDHSSPASRQPYHPAAAVFMGSRFSDSLAAPRRPSHATTTAAAPTAAVPWLTDSNVAAVAALPFRTREETLSWHRGSALRAAADITGRREATLALLEGGLPDSQVDGPTEDQGGLAPRPTSFGRHEGVMYVEDLHHRPRERHPPASAKRSPPHSGDTPSRAGGDRARPAREAEAATQRRRVANAQGMLAGPACASQTCMCTTRPRADTAPPTPPASGSWSPSVDATALLGGAGSERQPAELIGTEDAHDAGTAEHGVVRAARAHGTGRSLVNEVTPVVESQPIVVRRRADVRQLVAELETTRSSANPTPRARLPPTFAPRAAGTLANSGNTSCTATQAVCDGAAMLLARADCDGSLRHVVVENEARACVELLLRMYGEAGVRAFRAAFESDGLRADEVVQSEHML